MPDNIKDVLIGILLGDTLRCIVLFMLLLYLFQINICFQENIFLFNNPNLIFLSCLSPIFIYNELNLEKPSVLTENKGKSGVYFWTNKVNGKMYIGSSVDLAKRLKNYFYIYYLKEFKYIMLIYKALLAHCFGNFRFDILEHCKPFDLIKREEYYIYLLNPEYNILKFVRSRLRAKHNEQTIAKIKARALSRTEEALAKNREHLKVLNANQKHMDHLAKLNASLEHIAISAKPVLVFNMNTGESVEYRSMTQAANFFKVHSETIRRCIKSNKLLLNIYNT